MDTENKKLRLFIGIPLSSEDKAILKLWLSQLQPQLPAKGVSWVLPENYHITLEFLGMVDQEKIDTLYHCLQKVVNDFAPFSVELHDWLFFPNAAAPKIITVYVQLTEALGKLRATIHQQISALDFTLEERPYMPHVTVGRCKNVELHQSILKNLAHPYSMLINQIVLFESVKISDEIFYRPLKTFYF